jgi:shikimate dehydrogenase
VTSSSVPSLLALLAQPVSGNPMQYMIEKALAHHDLDWRYLTFEVAADNLGDAVRGLKVLGFHGGHCGNPHKEAVIPLLDRVTDAAAAIGAVNLFFREDDDLVGENVEGKGVLLALERMIDVAAKKIVILGAGRLARAAALELAAARAGEIIIVNRTEARANELAERLAAKFQVPVSAAPWQGDYLLPAGTDVLVHATSIDQDNNPALPIVLETLGPELIVADVSTHPPQTTLLHEAANRGCRTVDGLSMLIEQVATAIRLWIGVDPSREILRDAVEEYWEV